MARRSLATLVVLLLVVSGLVLWLAHGLGRTDSPAVEAAPGIVAPTEPAHSASTDLAAPTPTAPAAPGTPASARTLVEPGTADITGSDLAEANWVEGRLVFPEGTPLDERVSVVAQGRPFEHSKRLFTAPVDANGRFRVAFSKATTKGWLRLEARYLYLARSFEVKPDAPPADIRLEPILGGGFRCKLVPSAAAQPFVGELAGILLTASGWSEGSSAKRIITARTDANLECVLGGLAPDYHWSIHGEPKGFAEVDTEPPAIQRGVLQPLDLNVTRGAHIAGRVVDEAGAPVGKATLEFTWRTGYASGSGTLATTKEDGSFDCSGVRAGDVTIAVRRDAYVNAELDGKQLEDGTERTGVELVLRRGHSVAGRVNWPDGTPAAEVRLELTQLLKADAEGNRDWGDDTRLARTGADGTFVISGLGDGPYSISARSAPKEVATRLASSGKSGKPATAKARYSADVEGVETDRKDLVISLNSGNGVSGRVVDDLGRPVPNAKLTTEGERGESMFGRDGSVKGTSDADGRFELFGLKDGDWSLVASPKSGPSSEPRKITVPGETVGIELVIPRPAVITGFVIDPSGTPVAGARIEIDAPSFRWNSTTSRTGKSKSDDKGHFQLADAASGAVRMHAEHADWAQSAPIDLTLAPGQTSESITLRMQRGGTIAGLVQDGAGKPAGGRSISVWGRGETSLWLNTTSAADGTFKLERLPPGEVQVELQDREEHVRAVAAAAASTEGATAALPEFHRRVTVTIVDGAVAKVVLGGPSPAAVRLFGTVTSGGRPIAGASVSAYSREGASERESQQGQTDSEGHYAITLPEPGAYDVNVSDGGSLVNVTKAIPKAASFQLDMTLDSGRISGRVVSADGKPLAQIQVQLRAQKRGERAKDGPLSAVGGDISSGADGTFEFEHLGPGTYALTASMRDVWGDRGRETIRNAPITATGFELAAGAHLGGVELRLPQAGFLTGIVIGPGGAQVAGAQVAFWTTDMELSGGGSPGVQCDSAGRFKLSGLAPGTVTVWASAPGLAQRGRRSIAIQSQATVETTLQLEPGAALHIHVEYPATSSQLTELDVLDTAGQQQSTRISNYDPARRSDVEWVTETLVPGKYTVVLHLAGDEVRRQEVSVSAGADQTLRMSAIP